MRRIFRPIIHFITHRILHIEDSPHSIAMGVAIGLFTAWTPAMGLHILIVLSLTSVIKANKFAALTSVWISNIFTAIFIYYPNYLVGWYISSYFRDNQALSQGEIGGLFKELFAVDSIATCFCRIDFWQRLLALLMAVGCELWVGGLIVGSVVAVAAYFIFYHLIKWYRKIHPHR